jgi:type II secretory pathway pseudopilin PulG
MKNKSFTLVEIMAVMTIIVIVLSIGVSGYRNITSQSSFIIESGDLKNRIKSAVNQSLKSQTPTIFSVQMGKTQSEKSYLFGGRSSLIYSFDFDMTNKDGEWAPELGLGGVEFHGGTVIDECISSKYGMCLDSMGSARTTVYSINTTPNLVSTTEAKMSKSPYGYYIECKIKVEPGAQDSVAATVIRLKDSSDDYALKISQDGLLKSYFKGDVFPNTDEESLRVDTGRWMTIGHAAIRHKEDYYIHQIVDGTVVYSGNVDTYGDPPSFFDNTADSKKIEFVDNYNGLIDDIRIYDIFKGEIMPIDPKAGFVVIGGAAHYDGTTGSETTDLTVSSIMVDGHGRMVPKDNSASFIGLASSSIYGRLSYNADTGGNFRLNTTIRWRSKASKLSAMPESGYLLVHHRSEVNNHSRSHRTDRRYELVKYKEFDGLNFEIVARALGGTSKLPNWWASTCSVRYIEPVIFSRTGGVN